jgi:hypothetical protein
MSFLPRSEKEYVISLAKKRSLLFQNGFELRTPLLLPSFSSRVPKIAEILETAEDFIDGPVLISAYDIRHNHLGTDCSWASGIFLDSGGYEVSKITDLADVSDEPTTARAWTAEEHSEVLSTLIPKTPMVVISYDHPSVRSSLKIQIEHARRLKLPPNSLREILIKPETTDQHFIHIENIEKVARDLSNFDVIGVTEKEIGNSVFDRMLNVARLRTALNEVGIKSPIHVFGSLDTTTTLFYFVAGADIFDGLTWLRYGFKDGRTLYKQDFGITDVGVTSKAPAVEAVCWARNYNYLQEMQREMRRFLIAYEFGVFSHHSHLLKSVAENIEESLRR